MHRRFFITALGALAGTAAQGQIFSDSPRGTYRSPYPQRVLRPGETPYTTVVPPTSQLDAYDRPYYDPYAPTQHSVQSLRVPNWEAFFDTPDKGMIVASIEQRVVHYCSEDFSVQRAYLSSVPRSAEYERRGRTEIVKKRFEPTWIPTPDMRRQDPNLPREVGPGPDNPLGTRALNLQWQYYRIHGIDRDEKVGQPVSSGCFGLHNRNIEELFEMAEVGTQVVVV